MKKPEKLMSPGILEPVLHSSWQVQWWSEFNGVGKRNSDQGLKTPHRQYNLQVSLMASSHQRAWGCHSNVQSPALLKQDKDCMFSLLVVIQSSEVQAALSSPSHLSSNCNGLLSTERGWGKAAVSIWLSARKINGRSEGLNQRACCQHVLSAKLAWFTLYFMCFARWLKEDGGDILKTKDSSCLVTRWHWRCCGCLGNPSLLWLPPSCQLSGYSGRRQLIWLDVKRKHKENSSVEVHSLEVFQSFFITCLLPDSCCRPRKGQIKVLGFQKSNSQNSLTMLILSFC